MDKKKLAWEAMKGGFKSPMEEFEFQFQNVKQMAQRRHGFEFQVQKFKKKVHKGYFLHQTFSNGSKIIPTYKWDSPTPIEVWKSAPKIKSSIISVDTIFCPSLVSRFGFGI